MNRNTIIQCLKICAEPNACDGCDYKGKPMCAKMLIEDTVKVLEEDAEIEKELYEEKSYRLFLMHNAPEVSWTYCKDKMPKEGEWIESNRRPRSAQFYCSVCHRTCYDIQPTRDKAWTKRCRYHYCPNCGAKMRTVTDCHTLNEKEKGEQECPIKGELVLCKECDYRKPPSDYCEKLQKAYVPDYFYCKYGKRKEQTDAAD